MRWRPCSPDPMRRMRAAPTFACARRSSPWGRRFPSPPSGPPAMQARPPAAQGFQTRRAWQRGRPPAGSGQPVPRGMGLSHKFSRQATGNRPSNEARTASFKGRFALWFPFFVRVATAFSFASAPRERHAAPRAAALPQKGETVGAGTGCPGSPPAVNSPVFPLPFCAA